MVDQLIRPLIVSEVVRETADACSLALDPGPEADYFRYRPGQFLTIRSVDSVELPARCYSLASSPSGDEAPRIAVKRVPGGLVSNLICDRAKPGSVLGALKPAGLFVPRSLDHDVTLLAGGSGITPILSILKSVLSAGHGSVSLIYANTDERSVIFAREISALAVMHPDRLRVVHWLESVQGLPRAEQLAALCRDDSEGDFYICGPDGFTACATTALNQLGIDQNRIKQEKFSAPAGGSRAATSSTPAVATARAAAVDTTTAPMASAATAATAVTEEQTDHAAAVVSIGDKEHRVAWPREEVLLDVLLEKGLNVPFACREGACGACMCSVTGGTVNLRRNEVLDQEDLDDGYTLACQALPSSEAVSVRFD